MYPIFATLGHPATEILATVVRRVWTWQSERVNSELIMGIIRGKTGTKRPPPPLLGINISFLRRQVLTNGGTRTTTEGRISTEKHKGDRHIAS